MQNDVDNIEELSESAELVEENFDEAFRHTDTDLPKPNFSVSEYICVECFVT